MEDSCEKALQIPMAHGVSSVARDGDRVDTTLDRCCVSRDTDQKTSTCKTVPGRCSFSPGSRPGGGACPSQATAGVQDGGSCLAGISER